MSCFDCDLLIIDDLGSEFSTQFTVACIYNIINTRINLGKPVIISTNLTGEELEAKYTQEDNLEDNRQLCFAALYRQGYQAAQKISIKRTDEWI